MSQTKQVRPTRPTTTYAETDARVSVDRDAELAAFDAMLDEIDAVLEDNALEVVRRYVCKGGE